MEELLAVNFYSPVDLNYPNWHHWTGNNDEQREYGVMMAKKLLEEGNCHVVKWNTINEAVDKIGHLADILQKSQFEYKCEKTNRVKHQRNIVAKQRKAIQ